MMVTLESYLRRDYENERECEYVDGELVERTGGDTPHALLFTVAGCWFWEHREDWQIDALSSYSIWTSPTRIRVPDLMIMKDHLREPIRITPPLLCLEILAPEDHHDVLFPRLNEFLAMGVPHVWLLDPIERLAYTYTANTTNLVDTSRLSIPNSPIHLDLPELFARAAI